MSQTTERSKVVIESLTLEWKENYVVYSDTDSMTDYFNSSRGSLRYMIECIQKRGGDVIRVHFTNNEDLPCYMQRVKRIAKVCGYTWERTTEVHTPRPNESWTEIVIFLRKIQTDAPAAPAPIADTAVRTPISLRAQGPVQSDDVQYSLDFFTKLLNENVGGNGV